MSHLVSRTPGAGTSLVLSANLHEMALPKATNTSIQDLAATHAERAVDVLVEIMDSDLVEPKDRIRAAESLLNRGHGLPTQAIIVSNPASKMRSIAAAKSDAELVAVIEAKPLPRMGPPQSMVDVVQMTEADYDRAAEPSEFDTIEEPIDPMLL
jgi:hypothetical protein